MDSIINLTDIRRSNTAHMPKLPSRLLSNNLVGKNIKSKLKILNDIREIFSIDIKKIQNINDIIRNQNLTKILNPSNKIRGPIDSAATLKIRNKINIKCPAGTRKNLLNQCVKIR